MVEPTLQSANADETPPETAPSSIADLSGMLASAILGQGAAKDWVRANEINVRVEILHALVERLPAINERLGDPEAVALGRHIGDLAEQVAERRSDAGQAEPPGGGDDPAVEYLDRSLRRIEGDSRYAPALERVASRSGRARLAKLIFVLEEACGLGGKDVLPLYLVAPERPGALSGDFMGNFGGFFSRDWRANDFRAGRRDARHLLETALSDVVGYEAAEPEAYAAKGIEPSFDAIPTVARGKLAALIEAEVDAVLADLRPGAVASLLGWAWKPAVRRWASERTLRALRGMR
jgi:hypothetical protein